MRDWVTHSYIISWPSSASGPLPLQNLTWGNSLQHPCPAVGLVHAVLGVHLIETIINASLAHHLTSELEDCRLPNTGRTQPFESARLRCTEWLGSEGCDFEALGGDELPLRVV